MAQTYFATVAPGLEDALLSEVRSIGGKRARLLRGGVEFDAARKTLYRAALCLRTANRLWLRVDEFRSRDAPELYNKTRRFGWERLLAPSQPIAIRARSNDSNLYHTGKIADAVGDAIADHFRNDLQRSPPSVVDGTPSNSQTALTVMARLKDNRCQLNLDASGQLLHKRGWRPQQATAPLRESLAAAVLNLSGWTPDIPLLDPLCGSGTIPIEAAHQSLARPPGLERSFALETWANHQPKKFTAIANELRQAVSDSLQAPIIGADRDASVLQLARDTSSRAGLHDLLDWQHRPLQRWISEPPFEDRPFTVVTNPPYGHRLDIDTPMLSQLIELAQTGPATVVFLWPSDRRDRVEANADAPQRITQFHNGGIAVDLWRLT